MAYECAGMAAGSRTPAHSEWRAALTTKCWPAHLTLPAPAASSRTVCVPIAWGLYAGEVAPTTLSWATSRPACSTCRWPWTGHVGACRSSAALPASARCQRCGSPSGPPRVPRRWRPHNVVIIVGPLRGVAVRACPHFGVAGGAMHHRPRRAAAAGAHRRADLGGQWGAPRHPPLQLGLRAASVHMCQPLGR